MGEVVGRSRRQNTVKLYTKTENEPEVENGKVNQKFKVLHTFIMIWEVFLQAPAIPLAKEIHSHFWYKRDKNFITIVSNPVNTENLIPFLCQLHDSQGVH